MAITVATIQTELNTIIGDASTDRISAAERLQFINQAVDWLLTEMDNDHSIRTYSVSYFDTLNYYKLNAAVTDIFEGNALRRFSSETTPDLTKKDARQLLEDISSSAQESSYATERRDGNLYLVINHDSKYTALEVSSLDSLTGNGGTWAADTTTSDALTPTVDEADGSNGTTGCLTFDITVAQSVNNRATIYNSGLTAEDLTDDKDLSSWILDVKFPDVTNITSVTFYWGSSSTKYWSVTSTTQYDGSAFIADWNTLKFPWLGSTKTSTPDITAINYIRIDVNYGAGQADATSFKLDTLRLVRPEILTLHYSSWNVGTSSVGTQLKKFTATTDIPYFSGQYDNYMYPVAHKAGQLAYKSLRLFSEAREEELEALKELAKVKKIIPKSRPAELKNFKLRGVRFARGSRRRI